MLDKTKSSSATLIKPPPADGSKAEVETLLELTALSPIDPYLYTNTRPLWHAPGARGLYGGSIIAQCLAAAYKTVPEDLGIHSMHCYFVLAGNPDIPVLYHVERIRSGRSFTTRTVQARQKGNVIFTTTMSFVKPNRIAKVIQHSVDMPFVPGPDDDWLQDNLSKKSGPIITRRIDILNNDSPHAALKRTRQWTKCSGRMSDQGGHQAHAAALAYISDHYFIGNIARIHRLEQIPSGLLGQKHIKVEVDVRESSRDSSDKVSDEKRQISRVTNKQRPVISMIVSLDHTVYFHDARGFRADEWLFVEVESPWADDERGLVIQRIFTQAGKLIATCVQEGLARLKQDSPKL